VIKTEWEADSAGPLTRAIDIEDHLFASLRERGLLSQIVEKQGAQGFDWLL